METSALDFLFGTVKIIEIGLVDAQKRDLCARLNQALRMAGLLGHSLAVHLALRLPEDQSGGSRLPEE